jgi:pimeloyl-ACP methyl ester carboxylesterase
VTEVPNAPREHGAIGAPPSLDALTSARMAVEVPPEDEAGLPSFTLGSGPEVVFLPGLGFNHEPPTGAARALESAPILQLATDHEMHWLGRPRGLPAGVTIADIAERTADWIAERFGRPVPIIGFSTGGFVALQMAVSRPDVVRKLVVVGAASRLSPDAEASERSWAEHLAAGQISEAWQLLADDYTRTPFLAQILRVGLGTVGPWVTGSDTSDGVATVMADVAFDIRDRLSEIKAPTMLVAGRRDTTFEAQDLAEAAARIPDCQVLRLSHTGHVTSMLHPSTARGIRTFLA